VCFQIFFPTLDKDDAQEGRSFHTRRHGTLGRLLLGMISLIRSVSSLIEYVGGGCHVGCSKQILRRLIRPVRRCCCVITACRKQVLRLMGGLYLMRSGTRNQWRSFMEVSLSS